MSKALVKKPVDRLKDIINQPTVQEQFKNAMGKHSDLFVASLIDIFSDGLQKYEPGLVIQEALKAAVLRLPISKGLGFAYIVPYGGKPQFQIGYKGLIQLAMRSGQVKNINAGPVYEGEWRGTDKLRGTFDFSGKKMSEKIVGYFAYMELINGFKKTVYWTKEQVTAHGKAKSPSFNSRSSAWKTDFDAMATKTVIRALFSKYAPMSIDFVTAMACETNQDESPDINLELKDVTPPLEPKKKKQAVAPAPHEAPPANQETPTENTGEIPAEGNSSGKYVEHLDILNHDPVMRKSLETICNNSTISITQKKIDSAIADKDEARAKNFIELINSFIR